VASRTCQKEYSLGSQMKDADLSNSMSKFVDCQYSLGDTSRGWDCLSFIGNLYRTMGFKFQEEYRGITEQNYKDVWESGGGRKELEEYLLMLGESVDVEHIRRGDLVVFRMRDGSAAPGVYTGNGNVHVITEKGGKTIPFKMFERLKFNLIDIRRLL